MCIPFGKEWAVRGGDVIRCVGNKKKFYLEAVKGGNGKASILSKSERYIHYSYIGS
jgi:hypothetical protein